MLVSITKRALIGAAAFACLATAGAGFYLYRLRQPSAAAKAAMAPDILEQLPATAPAIFYADVAALRALPDSPLWALLAPDAGGAPEDSDYQNFVRATGFDYRHDLDKLAVALWPANLPSPSGAAAENRVLAVAEGHFDEGKIEAYALLSGKLTTSAARPIYEIPGSPPVALEFLSGTRLAMASGKDSAQLLAPANRAARDPSVQARIARVAGAQIFAVARTDALPESFYAYFRNSPKTERLVRSVQGLSLAGQPDGDRLHTTLDAECDSATNAVELAGFLEGLRVIGSVALSDPKTRAPMKPAQAAFLDALIRDVKITREEHRVRLTLDITPAMLAPTTPAN